MMILCGIVLYNPDIKRLVDCVNSVINQVDKIIFVDNGSATINDVKNAFERKTQIEFICNSANLGIAFALNQIISFGRKNNYDWVLTLDQDSICSEHMVENMVLASNAVDSVGIMCPLTVDVDNYCNDNSSNSTREMEWCITSGSLINLKNTEKCSFDNKMFIDLVDYDFSIQVKQAGLKIIRVYNSILYHRLGDLVVKKFLWFNVEVTNHNAMRRYYYVRNVYYILKKYNFDAKTVRFWKKKIRDLYFKVFFFENDKLNKIKMMRKGKNDSKSM